MSSIHTTALGSVLMMSIRELLADGVVAVRLCPEATQQARIKTKSILMLSFTKTGAMSLVMIGTFTASLKVDASKAPQVL